MEILRIFHDAMRQNFATLLISRSCLQKMSWSSSFLTLFRLGFLRVAQLGGGGGGGRKVPRPITLKLLMIMK